MTTDTTYAARGARIKVIRNSDSYVVYDGFTLDSGASAGCTVAGLNLDSTETYNVKVKSYASVGGNTLYVYDDDTTPAVYSHGPSTYSPPGNGTLTITTSVAEQWNISLAVGYAMFRFTGGLTGQTYVFYNEAGPNGGTEYDRTNDVVFISSGGTDNKYMIDHEFGHMIAARANDGGAPNKSYGATLDNCYTDNTESHEAASKEYQSAAVWEGIAHYYAVIAFNNVSTSDCSWVYYKDTNWNLDGDATDSQEPAELDVSCENYPTNAPTPDFLGNYCTGTLTNRGTEYDWLRFFWDMHTDMAISYDTMLDIWDEADPDTWNATGDSSGADYPATRLRDAANTLGYLTEWDSRDNINGVHR